MPEAEPVQRGRTLRSAPQGYARQRGRRMPADAPFQCESGPLEKAAYPASFIFFRTTFQRDYASGVTERQRDEFRSLV